MLNAGSETRRESEKNVGFIKAHEVFPPVDEDEDDDENEEIPSETFDMGVLPRVSVFSCRRSGPPIEVPKRHPTLAMIQRPIFEGIRLDAVGSEKPWVRLLGECVAELLGTAILVLFGCSGIAQYTLSRGALSSFLSVNFAFGFGAMIAVYVAGPVSGGHLNPAVTISMLSLRSITPLQCLTYIISQFIGAFIAAALVFGTYYNAIDQFDHGVRKVTGATSTAGIFGTLPAQGISQISLFFDQVLSTALLLIAICSLSNKRNKLVSNRQVPLAVGFVIVAIGVAFGYNCGFPINPARDLGPRLFTLCAGYGTEVFSVGNYYFWIPCIGPIFGGLAGTWIYYGYSQLMKSHVGEDEVETVRIRQRLDSMGANHV